MRLSDPSYVLLMGVVLFSSQLWAFEHTKVLPKGIRNLTLKSVNTTIGGKTNSDGHIEAIAKPLEKDLDFKRILKGESDYLKKTQLEGLMLQYGFDYDDSLGQIKADMKGSVAVTAPLLSYGLTDNFTLAIAVPYYQAKMRVKTGFAINQGTANRLLKKMEDLSQTKAANEVAEKLNDAIGELNKKLRDNNYREMTDWEGSGIGDVTIAGKLKAVDGDKIKLASTNGFVIPTGKTSDPDVLNDIPFGKGTLDFFTALAVDEYLTKDIFFNQFVKYTHHFPAKRNLRMATEDESIEVKKTNADYELGANWDSGVSVQYEPQSGFVAGIGYIYGRKYGDDYKLENNPESVQKLEKDTHQENHFWEAKLGYSGVNAYRRGELPAPFAASVEYKKHIASINNFSNDFVTVDLALYF
ncbi:MAG: hypothetical protein AB8G05_19595 [Oligoflexales bacterium]